MTLAMQLTPKEKIRLQEAKDIAREVGLDLDLNHLLTQANRMDALDGAIHKMVVSEIVFYYAALDEVLAQTVLSLFFGEPPPRNKKTLTFIHHILDEMYLLKKMNVMHAIVPLPKKVRTQLSSINGIRNAFTHSFFPELRKEHHKIKSVQYKGKDIRTFNGLKTFTEALSNHAIRDGQDHVREDIMDKERGLAGVRLIISDACLGLSESAAEVFPKLPSSGASGGKRHRLAKDFQVCISRCAHGGVFWLPNCPGRSCRERATRTH
jgi:hypothetical protein